MHVVVLTHHESALEEISKELKERYFEVYEVSSSISIAKRQKNILEFQKSVDAIDRREVIKEIKAKVLVATMKIGNVGITLTAASRVYLFEPCIHPQMEVQAAGRIHRLGQTRPVLVKKLVYRDSVESCIVSLHEAIRKGEVQITDGSFPKAAKEIVTKI